MTFLCEYAVIISSQVAFQPLRGEEVKLRGIAKLYLFSMLRGVQMHSLSSIGKKKYGFNLEFHFSFPKWRGVKTLQPTLPNESRISCRNDKGNPRSRSVALKRMEASFPLKKG